MVEAVRGVAHAGGRASPSGRRRPASPPGRARPPGSTLRSGTPARCISGCSVKPADGRRGRPSGPSSTRTSPRRQPARVRQRRLEQRPADALPLQAGPDGVRRQHPQQVAPERHREAERARRPSSATQQPPGSVASRWSVRAIHRLARRRGVPRRRGHAGSAARTSRRRCRPRRRQLLGDGHVLGPHRPDHERRSRSPTLATDGRHGRMARMRVVFAPDKFAGTLTAVEAAAAMAAGWAPALTRRRARAGADVRRRPGLRRRAARGARR